MFVFPLCEGVSVARMWRVDNKLATVTERARVP